MPVANHARAVLTAVGAIAAIAPAPAALAMRPPDRTPPAAVGNLGVAGGALNSITLTWTAVGDDGGGGGACPGAGTATAYDVRYSANPPAGDLNAWFNAATQATGEPAPQACGLAESCCLTGLAPGGTYYAALRVRDDANNTSPVSNVVSGVAGSAAGAMHVSGVSSGGTFGNTKRRGLARVDVVDALGAPVACATVTGQWTGCFTQSMVASTNAQGRATLNSTQWANCSNNNCCLIFTVTNVSHSGYVYDSGANTTSQNRHNCNPLLPDTCGGGLTGPACPADCSGDGTLDTRDFVCFLNVFAAGGPGADCDTSGALTVNDFVCFQNSVAAGCP